MSISPQSNRLQKRVWISIRCFPLGQTLLFQFFFQLSNLRHKKRYRPGRHFVNPRMPPLKSLRQQCQFCHGCRYRPGSPWDRCRMADQLLFYFFMGRGRFFFLMGKNSIFTVNLYSPYIFGKYDQKPVDFCFRHFHPRTATNAIQILFVFRGGEITGLSAEPSVYGSIPSRSVLTWSSHPTFGLPNFEIDPWMNRDPHNEPAPWYKAGAPLRYSGKCWLVHNPIWLYLVTFNVHLESSCKPTSQTMTMGHHCLVCLLRCQYWQLPQPLSMLGITCFRPEGLAERLAGGPTARAAVKLETVGLIFMAVTV